MKTKTKKCKVCSKPFEQFNSIVTWCSPICGYALSNIKLKEKKANEWKTEKKELRNNLTNWKGKLQDQVNKITRLIDKDLLCLARNIKGQIHAGHVFARGGNQTIRYNLHNIHRQSAHSNTYQNDDGLLREGLVNEYGLEYMTFISELRQTPTLKLSQSEYKDLYYKSRKIVLRLEKANINYSLKNRIIMRNKINKELGIYSDEFCIFGMC